MPEAETAVKVALTQTTDHAVIVPEQHQPPAAGPQFPPMPPIPGPMPPIVPGPPLPLQVPALQVPALPLHAQAVLLG